MHRFSPHSNRGIKGRKNGVRVPKPPKPTKAELENNLVNQLINLGYSFERANGCLSYLDKPEINLALDFISKF